MAMITGDTAKTTITQASIGGQTIIDNTTNTAKNILDYSTQGTTKGI